MNSYIDMTRSFFYELHYHKENGLVSQEEWDSWQITIIKFVTQPYTRGYMLHNSPDYTSKFNNYLKSILKPNQMHYY
jgi:hypothetical protein